MTSFAPLVCSHVRVHVCAFVLAFMFLMCAHVALHTHSVHSVYMLNVCVSVLSPVQFSDLKALHFIMVIMWLRLIMCMQTVSIKLGRSKRLSLSFFLSIPYTTLLIPLSTPPVYPPFQHGNSMLSNFFQMLSPSLPLFPALFPPFLILTGLNWSPKVLPPPPFLANPLTSSPLSLPLPILLDILV